MVCVDKTRLRDVVHVFSCFRDVCQWHGINVTDRVFSCLPRGFNCIWAYRGLRFTKLFPGKCNGKSYGRRLMGEGGHCRFTKSKFIIIHVVFTLFMASTPCSLGTTNDRVRWRVSRLPSYENYSWIHRVRIIVFVQRHEPVWK